jgi:hypothetical protein
VGRIERGGGDGGDTTTNGLPCTVGVSIKISASWGRYLERRDLSPGASGPGNRELRKTGNLTHHQSAQHLDERRQLANMAAKFKESRFNIEDRLYGDGCNLNEPSQFIFSGNTEKNRFRAFWLSGGEIAVKPELYTFIRFALRGNSGNVPITGTKPG